MAIVIPSKHIYEKDNDKVRDNKIDKVEIDGTYITPNASDGGVIHTEEITFEGEITSPYTIQWLNAEQNEMTGFACVIESKHDVASGGKVEEKISVNSIKGGLQKVEFIEKLSPNILEFRVKSDTIDIDKVAYVTVNREQTFYSIYKDTNNSNYWIFWVNIGRPNRYTAETVSRYDTTFITHNLYRSDTAGTFSYAIAKAINTKFYCNGLVYVPKNSANKTITNILSSKKEEETKNVITYSSTCTVKTCEIYKPFNLPFGVKNNGGATTVGNGSYVAYLGTTKIPDISMDDRKFGNAMRIDKFERGDAEMAQLSVKSTASFTNNGRLYGVNAIATLADETTSSKIDVFDTADGSGYIVDFKILVGTGIDILSAVGEKVQFTEIKENTEEEQTITDVPFGGKSKFYFPNNISINFYGNTIGIDMNDKTITINGNGSHPISFEGNELMQTTNYVMENGTSKDYLTTAFGKTMDLYKNGKETATILCDIHDAEYWVTKNLTFEKQNPSSQTFPFYTTRLMDRADADYYFFEFYGYSVGAGFDSIYIVGIDGAEILQQRIDLTTGDFSCTGKVPKDASSASISVVCDKEEKYSANLHILLDAADNINPFEYLNGDATDDTITINGVKLNVADDNNEFILAGANDLTAAQFHALQKGVEKLRFATNKLCFNIGDIVIPMVYGANGVDKPMSKYKDGSPKKFQVQGVRVFYDGAVWQELTLQEFS